MLLAWGPFPAWLCPPAVHVPRGPLLARWQVTGLSLFRGKCQPGWQGPSALGAALPLSGHRPAAKRRGGPGGTSLHRRAGGGAPSQAGPRDFAPPQPVACSVRYVTGWPGGHGVGAGTAAACTGDPRDSRATPLPLPRHPPPRAPLVSPPPSLVAPQRVLVSASPLLCLIPSVRLPCPIPLPTRHPAPFLCPIPEPTHPSPNLSHASPHAPVATLFPFTPSPCHHPNPWQLSLPTLHPLQPV